MSRAHRRKIREMVAVQKLAAEMWRKATAEIPYDEPDDDDDVRGFVYDCEICGVPCERPGDVLCFGCEL